jgi:hypothetical protein
LRLVLVSLPGFDSQKAKAAEAKRNGTLSTALNYKPKKTTRRPPIAAAVPGEHGPDSTFSRVHWGAPATMKRRARTYRRNDGTGADQGGKHSRINRPIR